MAPKKVVRCRGSTTAPGEEASAAKKLKCSGKPEADPVVENIDKVLGTVVDRLRTSLVEAARREGEDSVSSDDSSKAEAVQLVGRVLAGLEEATTKRIDSLEKKIQEAESDTERLNATKNLMEANVADAKNIVGSKIEMHEEARRVHWEAEASLEEAQQRQEQTAAELVAQTDLLKSYKETFNDHFIPLRDGRYDASGWPEHITETMSLFKLLEFEESLKCAFKPAASHKPGKRGRFDRLAFTEAEEEFERAAARLEEDRAALALQAQKCAADVEVAQASANEAQGAEQATAGQLEAARAQEREAEAKLRHARRAVREFPNQKRKIDQDRDAEAQELEELRKGALSAYQWLLCHERRQGSETSDTDGAATGVAPSSSSHVLFAASGA